MRVYEMFEGDKYRSYEYDESIKDIMNIQYEMYSYISSSMRFVVQRKYLYSPQISIFLDNDEIEFMDNNYQSDHRLVQNVHDTLAAIFRWKLLNDGATLSFFPTNAEIKELFQEKYVDTDFLDSISSEYHCLCKQWYDFSMIETETNSGVIRTMGRMLYPKNEKEVESRWKNSQLAAKILKDKYSQIKWIV